MRTAQEETQEPLRHRRLTGLPSSQRRAASPAWRSAAELRRAAIAAQDVMTVMQRVAQRGHTIPGLLVGDVPATCWAHYPDNDAYDASSGYRYYYHVHPRRPQQEHGHFHLFHQPTADAQATHLVAIAVDPRGLPLRLFTTNRWVTDERLQPAANVLDRLRRFALHRPARLQPVNDWLSAVVTLFVPQIRALLDARDQRLGDAPRKLLDDRRTEILSAQRISLPTQIRSVERLLTPTPAGDLQ